MRVLGLAVSHNGAAALVQDGVVRVSVQLERLERVKRYPLGLTRDGAGPGVVRAVNYCLRAAGITIEDLDAVAAATPFAWPGEVTWPFQPVQWVPHHLAHAEYVLHFSDLTPGLVLIVDGHGTHEADRPRLSIAERIDPGARIFDGEMETVSAYRFDGINLSLVYRQCGNRDCDTGRVMPSIGSLWRAASHVVFGRSDQAGKVMGLAAYGERRSLGKLLTVDNEARLSVDPVRLCAPGLRYRDLAREVQEQTSEAVLELLRRLRAQAAGGSLYYSGGVALNVVSNERIIREHLFDSVHMNGSCEDNGTAIGAALAVSHATTGLRVTEPVTEYLGMDHHALVIRPQLDGFPVTYERLAPADLVDAATRALSAGEVVGWFQGRSEFGPRALGNRSIFADPRVPGMKDRLNGRVKRREPFRPYGASARADRAKEYFDIEGRSPVMLREARVMDPELPAVTHVDGSCRLQTVAEPDNPLLFQLLSRFGDVTGKPVLLNTSMNVAGEPIVESPREAVETLLRTDIDALAIGAFLVRKT